MASRIKLVSRFFKESKKSLVFILNADVADSKVLGLWNFWITDKGKFKGSDFSVDMQPGEFYNAIRAYLDERKIRHEAHGNISEDYITRTENAEGLLGFLRTAEYYKALKERVHSLEHDSKLVGWETRLRELASRYKT